MQQQKEEHFDFLVESGLRAKAGHFPDGHQVASQQGLDYTGSLLSTSFQATYKSLFDLL